MNNPFKGLLPHEDEPLHPERVKKVLGYFLNGCVAGIGTYEWDTLRAALRRCAPADHQQSNVDFMTAARASYLGDCTDSDERLAAAWWGWRAGRGEIPAKSDSRPAKAFDYFQGDADRHWYYVEQGTSALEAKGPFMTKACAIQHSKDGTFRVID